MTYAAPSVEAARKLFPALDSGFAFLENAGGSQVPACVIDAMASFMQDSYVQTTAGYPASDRSTAIVKAAHEFCETFMGVDGQGKVVLGASTTQLLNMLSWCYSSVIQPGDDVVVSVANHEANVGPWTRLERFGAQVKWWGVDPETGEMRLDDLLPLLSDRTRIVAFPHTSNLLGNVVDVRAVTDAVHAVGGRVVVDGVAYAPHRFMEVGAWGVDYYAYSTYKVYGPHMAALYGRSEAWAGLAGPNHYFIPEHEVPGKFELGSLSFEGCAAIVALGHYLEFLSGRGEFDREAVRLATAQMRTWEKPLSDRLIGYLNSKPGVRIVGPTDGDRVPTVSFTSERRASPDVVAHVNQRGFGIRYGHLYSHRLTEALGVAPAKGFVRVSAVHYNTLDEIERLCLVLDDVL